MNPDPSPPGLGPSAPEEGGAGARRAKFEAGEAASGAPGFSGGAGAQMATQVEPLLPGGAPLLQAEEHGGLVRKKPPPSSEGKSEPGANDVGGGEPDGGARRPRPPCAKPHKEGTGQLERESPRPPQPPGAEGPAVSDGEEGGGGGGEPAAGGGAAGAAGAGRRDFVEAPPPKVNPWTKNALPPVLATVNGQSPPGGSFCLVSWVRGLFRGHRRPLPQRPPGPGGPPLVVVTRGFCFLLSPGSFGSPCPVPQHTQEPAPARGPGLREAAATAWAAAVSGQRRGPGLPRGERVGAGFGEKGSLLLPHVSVRVGFQPEPSWGSPLLPLRSMLLVLVAL